LAPDHWQPRTRQDTVSTILGYSVTSNEKLLIPLDAGEQKRS
jgi:hypothetical protein